MKYLHIGETMILIMKIVNQNMIMTMKETIILLVGIIMMLIC